MLRSCYALGIGLALIQSSASAAGQEAYQTPHTRAAHHHGAMKAGADQEKTLLLLKTQVLDLHRQIGPIDPKVDAIDPMRAELNQASAPAYCLTP